MTSYVKTATTLGHLSSSSRYKRHLIAVKKAIEEDIETSVQDKDLINQTNDIIQEIDQEIHETYRFIVETYNERFPELESLVTNRMDYIRTVQRIGNEMDLSLLTLHDILNPKQIMIVSVSSSTTAGLPLSSEKLSLVMRGCEEIIILEKDKMDLLHFLETCMTRLAPNLCALVGSHITAQLVGIAGGLDALVKIPSCNLQILGQEKRNLLGLSAHSSLPHAGILAQCEIVTSTPPDLKKKAVKTIAAKVALAARIDLARSSSSLSFTPGAPSAVQLVDDHEGERLRSEILKKLDQAQEPSKARTKKALPVPEEKKKARRGGKRVRRMKERMAMTEVAKAANRVSFDMEGNEYGDSAMGVENVLAGLKDSQKLRAPRKVESQFLKKAKKAVTTASSGQTSGLSSSLVFTPVQGLELVNPNAAAQRVQEANQKWFSAASGFLSAKPKAN